MKLQRVLCNYLQQHFPSDVHKEPWCTCGSPNHVRMLVFRIDGWPATVFVPEGCELTAVQLGRAIPGARVESVTEAELDAVYLETELGRMQPFDNAFGAAVYMDHNLTHFDTLVFCPKMFSGRNGECFRVPTKEFRELVLTVILPLFPLFEPTAKA